MHLSLVVGSEKSEMGIFILPRAEGKGFGQNADERWGKEMLCVILLDLSKQKRNHRYGLPFGDQMKISNFFITSPFLSILSLLLHSLQHRNPPNTLICLRLASPIYKALLPRKLRVSAAHLSKTAGIFLKFAWPFFPSHLSVVMATTSAVLTQLSPFPLPSSCSHSPLTVSFLLLPFPSHPLLTAAFPLPTIPPTLAVAFSSDPAHRRTLRK